MPSTVTIGYHQGGAFSRASDTAIIAVDVIRATTTISTAVALGRRCFPVASTDAAHRLAASLTEPLLAGEQGGNIPQGFDMNNSPAELARRTDITRPLILLSSSGTRLIQAARQAGTVYIGSLRNFTAVAREVAKSHTRVAVMGAGSRGEFREEDQMCCAWIANQLMENGFTAGTAQTVALVKQWQDSPVEAIMESASADFLIRTGQAKDLEFVLTHVADLDDAYVLDGSEIVTVAESRNGFLPIQPLPQGGTAAAAGR